MARIVKRLTPEGIKALKHDGRPRPMRFPDGENLYLQLSETGGQQWLLRYRHQGKERWLGLGRVELNAKKAAEEGGTTLAGARAKASAARTNIKEGRDPLAARGNGAGVTFEAAALELIKSREGAWRSPKSAEQWRASLTAYAFPAIGQKPVTGITAADIEALLKPIWHEIPETARRVRQRLEAVFSYARAKGWRPPELQNPAGLKDNLAILLDQKREAESFPSLPWEQVPQFMVELDKREGMAALALAFCILTAARSGAVRKARWRDMDISGAVWVAPAATMKAGKTHRTPLAPEALAILEKARALANDPKPGDYVFPSRDAKGEPAPLSNMAMGMLVRGMCFDGLEAEAPARWRDHEGRAVTVHGFRSSFKEWSIAAGMPDHLSEMALAHADRKKTRAAYARLDHLETRRTMMEKWAEAATHGPAAPVMLAEHRAARMAAGV
ncbi:MAG: tyrosine-type recombinase/integrase [Roseomonas sp.]|nr:tyrosine-type recombinase/integrase [Roseomonas sp.]MCA3370011.1 tyrosine-type recombinase/integrase [Roseomonas sp.]